MPSDTTGFWTPVALSADLPAGTVMPARTSAGSIALWRSESGCATASADRCPHRGMRLSHGFVRGEALSCIYHGWTYSRGGSCTRIPAHPGLTPPETIRVTTHAVEEVDGVIWVAVGEPTGVPPRFDGLAAFRSLSFGAGVAAIEAAADAKATAQGLLDAGKYRFLLAPQEDVLTLAHVLLPSDASPSDRIAASRAAECMRRTAEDIQTKGVA